MAGDNFTAEALMLESPLSVFKLFVTFIGISGVVCKLNFKALFIFDLGSNSLLQSYGSWKMVTQTVESTGYHTRDYRMAGHNSVTETSMVERSLSVFT